MYKKVMANLPNELYQQLSDLSKEIDLPMCWLLGELIKTGIKSSGITEILKESYDSKRKTKETRNN